MAENQKTRVALVGAGNMGSALKVAIEKSGSEVQVLGRNDSKESALNSEIVLFAVKPKDIETAVSEVTAGHEQTVFSGSIWSVAAAPAIEYFEKRFPSAKVSRLMPNTPIEVGAGAIGVVFSNMMSEEEKERESALLCNLLGGGGEIVELENENQLSFFTAISGSSPAYFFAFAEALERAGEKLGLKSETAKKLAEQSLVGAGELLRKRRDFGSTATSLREEVTSKGGTTEAALSELESAGLEKLVFDAASACAKKFDLMQSGRA